MTLSTPSRRVGISRGADKDALPWYPGVVRSGDQLTGYGLKVLYLGKPNTA
jgi:hypothetical protein